MSGDELQGLSREDLVAIILRQARKVEELAAENMRILGLLEEARRAGKRQAGPFSKGPPKSDPKPPGRKSGKDHGPSHFRAAPQAVDEEHEAPVPEQCPRCGGRVVRERIAEQFQTEIPVVRPVRRRFRVHVGRCRRCRLRVQGRHPLQTSDALGAAASQLGPNALALAAHLHGAMGASFGKVSGFFERVLGVTASRGGLALGLGRLAAKAEPTYADLIRTVRRSPVAYSDETSGRENGRLRWKWAFTTPTTTVYAQRPSRGFDVIEEILGADFDGVVVHDGWAPYDGLKRAVHQQCAAHALRRTKELLETAPRGARGFLRAVKKMFQAALRLRDRRDAGEISAHGLAVARGRLCTRMEEVLSMRLRYGPNRVFQNHLRRHYDEWLNFLWLPGVEATNWPAEQAIRPAVIFRKMSGGHRSRRGARTHDVLTSILRTSAQRGADALDVMARMLRVPRPAVVPIAH